MGRITYDLEQDNYYDDIKQYSKQVVAKLEQESDDIVADFMDFIQEKEIEKLRSKEEYLFEFLALGVLANQYLNDVLETSKSSYFLLQKLFELRSKNNKFKRIIDLIRGILTTLLLHSDERSDYRYEFVNKNDLKMLIQWLEATGEYQEEVQRFKKWEKYFSSKYSIKVSYDLKVALNLATWFKEHSKKELGEYTNNVEDFLAKKHHHHLWKEDVLLCAKPEVEYHLNMVGAEIMNQVLRPEFLATEEKIVLAPVCMRAKSTEDCQAQESELGLECNHCDSDCNINLISSLGSQGEFKVIIINHTSDFSDYLKKWEEQKRVGLIGITCTLNLLLGGYQMRRLNIPAQCIVLDYCGCKSHWSKTGVVTDINLDKLLEIIEADPNDKFVQMRFFSD